MEVKNKNIPSCKCLENEYMLKLLLTWYVNMLPSTMSSKDNTSSSSDSLNPNCKKTVENQKKKKYIFIQTVSLFPSVI